MADLGKQATKEQYLLTAVIMILIEGLFNTAAVNMLN